MRKIITILIFTLLVSSFSVYAATFSELGDEAILIWNPDGNVTTDSSAYTYSVSTNGGVSYDTGVFQTSPASGNFDDSTRQPVIYDSTSSNPLGTYKEFTTCVWTNINDNTETAGSLNYIFSNTDAGGINDGGLGFWWNGATGQYQSQYIYGGFMGLLVNYNPPDTVTTPGFSQYCTVINETGGTIFNTVYHNGSQVGQSSDTNTLESTTQDLVIGDHWTAATRTVQGNIDCLTVYNRSLSQDEINTLYTEGVGGSCPAAVQVSQPVITVDVPFEHFFTADDPLDFNFSISIDPNLELKNISIFINGTINSTLFTDANSTLIVGEGEFELEAIIYDNSSQSGTSGLIHFHIDRTNPFDNLASQIVAGSEYSSNQIIVVTSQNTNLYAHNITIINSLGDQVFSEQYLNLSLPQHGISVPINVSWGLGQFFINSSETDDHTSQEIGNYNVIPSVSNKELIFETGQADISIKVDVAESIPPSGVHVNILNSLQSISHNKNFDRYNLGFEWVASPPEFTYRYEFIVSASESIYQRNTEFIGHLVIGNSNWLDFQNDGFSYTLFEIERINDKSVRVIMETPSNSVNWRSLGGLNFGSSTSFFDIVEPTFNSHTCDFGSGFESCSNLDPLDSLEQTRVDCSNTDSATIGIFRDDILLVESAASKASDLFTLDNMDFVFTDGQTLKINSSCQAQTATIITTQSFIASTPPPITGNSIVNFPYSTYASTLIILVLLVFLTKSLFRRKK